MSHSDGITLFVEEMYPFCNFQFFGMKFSTKNQSETKNLKNEIK
jgi:hypothetical protein